MNLDNLRKFLVESKELGYSNEKAPTKKESDGSTSMYVDLGDWSSHDNFFGGEPYGGRLIVFYKKQPYWMMVYYGYVSDSWTDFGSVYGFLRKSLREMSEDHPFRGPKSFKKGKFEYANKWAGGLGMYSGHETINHDGVKIYEAWYMGGIVDVRKE